MSTNQVHARRARSRAAYALENLTYKRDGRHFPKVCCTCDRFILYGDEDFINNKWFEENKVRKSLSKAVSDGAVDLTGMDGDYGLSESSKLAIQDYYTVSASIVDENDWNSLKELYLSPRTYCRPNSQGSKLKFEFGICKQCKTSLIYLKKQSLPTVKPGHSFISNGRMFGPPPRELSSLNEVELAMVSLARVDHHCMTFQGGPHQAITGWHSLFANDVSATMRTANWCKKHSSAEQNFEEGMEEAMDIEDDSDMDDDNGDVIDEPEEKRKPRLASICVILTGPFTKRQKAILRKKTRVRWQKIREALIWLKANNRLYADQDIDVDAMQHPIVIDDSLEVPHEMNNIETVFQMEAVFPDTSTINSENGGFDNRQEFFEENLEQMLSRADGKTATLISRPTHNTLYDYQGENLLLAFPLQFPYGVGARDVSGEFRSGVGHYRHLSYTSSLTFQLSVFTCVLHNMFERQRMIAQAHYRRLEEQYASFTDITAESMEEAIKRYANGAGGNAPSDQFLRRCNAVTAGMAHTVEAAKRARTAMYALIARFGLPAVMFTICPLDNFCFRILIYFDVEDGFEGVPDGDVESDPVRELIVKMGDIRHDYPGLVAMEYENVLRIIMKHIVGIDMKSGENIRDEGLFGDVLAACPCTEEQGRKTLHAHTLIWLKDWKKLYEGLGSDNETTREHFARQLKKYADSVQTTEIFGDNDAWISNPCDDSCESEFEGIIGFDKCTLQDLRELRTKTGYTSFGDKAIVKCRNCGVAYTSEDLAVASLVHKFSRNRIYDDGNKPTYKQDFWEKGAIIPKARLEMEMHVLRQSEPHRYVRKENDDYMILPKQRQCIGFKMNLHKTAHTKPCFKKDCECRMKLPQPEQKSTTVYFNDKKSKWYTWTGENIGRRLFYLAPKRSHADCFANLHNKDVSDLFKCNNNIVTAVDGGSAMYVTSYHSKNTQDEDSKKAGEAAKKMIKKMNKELKDRTAKMKETAEAGILPDDIDHASMGLRTMIRSVFLACNAHVVGAPLAAYLTRNQSRFWHSHDYVFAHLNDFFKVSHSDVQLAAFQTGKAYIKSHVLNYLRRPKRLDKTCLYDFLENYTTGPKNNTSWAWEGDHPSGDRLAVKEANRPRIPLISFRDFVDTRDFEGEDLLKAAWPVEDETKRNAMEQYAKFASVCFIPFRKAEELKKDESYVLRVREYGFLEKHLRILQNIQDMHNSLKAGRPKDILERGTRKPREAKNNDNDVVGGNGPRTAEEEAFSMLVEETVALTEFPSPSYRAATGELAFDSRIVTCLGSHKCGSKLITAPTVTMPPNGHLSTTGPLSDGSTEDELTYHDGVDIPSQHALNALVTEETKQAFDPRWNKEVPKATGTLPNIRAYAKAVFGDDLDQRKAFECMAADFCVKVRQLVKDDAEGEVVPQESEVRESKRRKYIDIVKPLAEVNHQGQFICFLSGFGGSGKSHVIKGHIRYCSSFSRNIGMKFDRRTIVVTAMTGSAAVAINGETAHSAAHWNADFIRKKHCKAYANTIQFILDEVSFGNCDDLKKNENHLRLLMEISYKPYGGLSIIYAGDMSQLKPVLGKPIYLEKDFELWNGVHTFLELKTNHRFKKDPEWGELLTRFRDNGPTKDDVDIINTRVIGLEGGPTETEIPLDATYAVKNNIDRASINDGIFAAHLVKTHNKNADIAPPKHTIILKASDACWHKGDREYTPMNTQSLDILYACCGDGSVMSKKGSKYYDPFMKLYYKRPVMLTENEDVANCAANGTMCEFEGVVFCDGVGYEQLEKVIIDGYYVWCASISQIKALKLRILDGLQKEGEILHHYLKPKTISCKANYPLPLQRNVDRNSDRTWRNIRMSCFQLNIANSRTVHKLQGRSIKNLVISVWDYTGNWVYVALSRVTTMNGLFLRLPLIANKCRGMSEELIAWLDEMRKRTPPEEKESDFV